MFGTFWIDLAAAIFLGTGWGTYEVDSKERMGELLNTTERHGTIEYPDNRDTNQPAHLVGDRVHGGITPGQGNLPVP